MPKWTLMEEISPIITEKHLFGIPDEQLQLNNFLEQLDYQGFNARISIKNLSIEEPQRIEGSH